MYSTPTLNDPSAFAYFDEERGQIVVEDWKKRLTSMSYGIPESVLQLRIVPMLSGPKDPETGQPLFLYILALADTQLFISRIKY